MTDKDRNTINFTFIAPLWPEQDRVTRVLVRLLGPCFKTGQVDTDLLAIDCHTCTETTDNIDRPAMQTFRAKHRKYRKANTCLDYRTVQVLCLHTPHKRRTLASQLTGGRTKFKAITPAHTQGMSDYLPSTFAYGCLSINSNWSWL